MRPLDTSREVRLSLVVVALALGACNAGSEPAPATTQTSDPLSVRDAFHDFGRGFAPSVHARVVAQGIPGAGAITQIGTFHRGGPFHDKAPFAALTAPGMILDGKRLFVASTSSFGAPLAPAGAFAIQGRPPPRLMEMPSGRLAAGSGAVTAAGLLMLFRNAASAPE